MATETVRLIFLGDASSALRSTRVLASSLGTTGAAARTAQAALLTLAVGGLGFAAKAAADFDKTLSVLQATTDATVRQMGAIRREAIALGRDTKLPATSARDAAEAMLELAKGGLTVKEAMDAARGVLELSVAAQIGNAEAAKIVARALNAFALEGNQAVRVADVLANAANASTGEIGDFALALQQSSAIAAQLGLSVEETTAALMALADAGIVGSDAGTSLRVMLTRLNPITDKARELYKELGISAFDAKGEFVGFRDVIRQFEPIFRRATDEERQFIAQTVFGTDAQRAYNIVLGLGSRQFDEYVKQAAKSGSAHKLAEAQTKGFAGAMEALQSAAETLAISVGATLTPELENLARWLAEVAADLSENKELQDDMREAVSALAGFVRGFAEAADTAAEAVGGWENAMKLLLAAWVFTRLARLGTAITKIRGTPGSGGSGGDGLLGAAAAAALLDGRLRAIAALGVIGVTINMKIEDSDVPEWAKTVLHALFDPGIQAGKLAWEALQRILSDDQPVPVSGERGGPAAAAAARVGGRDKYPGRASQYQGGRGAASVIPIDYKATVRGGPGVGTHAQRDWQSGNAYDVFAQPGTPVVSPVNGTVVKVSGTDPARGTVTTSSGKKLYGWGITIQGGSEATTFYIAHLDQVAVRPGQKVMKGQLIGYVAAWKGGSAHVHVAQPWGITPGTGAAGGRTEVTFGDEGAGLGLDTDGSGGTGSKAADAFQLPLSLRRRIARAEVTGGRRDDLAAYQAGAAWVRRRLPSLTGEREVEALALLRSLQDRIKAIRKEIADAVEDGLREAAERARQMADEWRRVFEDVGQAAMQGFDDATSGHRTPAEALLASLLYRDEETSLLDAVAEAEKRLGQARAGSSDSGQLARVREIVGRYTLAGLLDQRQAGILGGGTASLAGGLLAELQQALTETQADAEEVADAERALERARFNVRLFYLRQVADEERESYEKQRALLRAHLAEMLAIWGDSFRQAGFTPQQAASIVAAAAELSGPGAVYDLDTRIANVIGGRAIPMQHGGRLLVRKPTLFLAGEAGTPELATFTPMPGGRPVGGDGVAVNVFVDDAMGWLRPFIRAEAVQAAGEISVRLGAETSRARREGRY